MESLVCLFVCLLTESHYIARLASNS
jgi:hypothetical protein